MTKELQNLAWACLPPEARGKMRQDIASCDDEWDKGWIACINYYFGRANVISDIEPEEMLMTKASDVRIFFVDSQSLKMYPETKSGGELIESMLKRLFGDKCLPDNEKQNSPKLSNSFQIGKDEQPSSNVAKKFQIGQKVRAKGTKQIGTIKEPYSNDVGYRVYFEDGDGGWDKEYSADELEPYTEPKTKEIMESNFVRLADEPENTFHGAQSLATALQKELNLCEFLKDCKGEEFYSLMHGKVRFMTISADGFIMFDYPESISVYDNGKYDLNAEVIIFPSRALYEKYPLDAYSAWMEWKSERTPKRWRAKESENYWYIDGVLEISCGREDYMGTDDKRYLRGNYFCTKEEAHQAAEAVRDCLMKFHEKSTER